MSLAALAAAVRAGEVDPVEVAQAQLARIVAEDAALHAFIAVDAARVLGDAAVVRRRVAAGEHLTLAGVPVAVKDAFDVAGLPTTANARWFAGATPARADSAVSASCALPSACGAMLSGQWAAMIRSIASAFCWVSMKRGSIAAGSATTRSRRQAGPPPLAIDCRTSTA